MSINIEDMWNFNEQPLNEMSDNIKKDWAKVGYHPNACTCLYCEEIEGCNYKFDLINTYGNCIKYNKDDIIWDNET